MLFQPQRRQIEVIVTDQRQSLGLESVPRGTPTLLFIVTALTQVPKSTVHFGHPATRLESTSSRTILLARARTTPNTTSSAGGSSYIDADPDRSRACCSARRSCPRWSSTPGEVVGTYLEVVKVLDHNLAVSSRNHSAWRFLSILIPLAVFGIILLVG